MYTRHPCINRVCTIGHTIEVHFAIDFKTNVTKCNLLRTNCLLSFLTTTVGQRVSDIVIFTR